MAVTHIGLSHTIFCHRQQWTIPYDHASFTKTGGKKCARRCHLMGAKIGPYESVTL